MVTLEDARIQSTSNIAKQKEGGRPQRGSSGEDKEEIADTDMPESEYCDCLFMY